LLNIVIPIMNAKGLTMSTASQSKALQMLPRSLFSVPDAAGVEITCREGSIWITLDHDVRDIVLDAGQSFVAGEHRRALIYALGTARVDLRPAGPQAAPVAARPLLAARAPQMPAAVRA
jgi:hypothetical protein